MESQQESGSEIQQEQQRRFTAYFDLLPGITRQFGETMASNRQAKGNAVAIEPQRISTEEDAGSIAGSGSVTALTSRTCIMRTDEAA